MSDHPVREVIFTRDLYAWVGEDELGSGVVGLKQGIIPAIAEHGFIALVSFTPEKLSRDDMVAMNEAAAAVYGKPRYLVRYTAVEIVGQANPVNG